MNQQIQINNQEIHFREAILEDWNAIASLHAESWKQNYKGIYSEDFLNNDVLENRRLVWSERFRTPSENQYILIAETDNEFLGFACTYLDYKNEKEHYMDNLHVNASSRGKGIGAYLLKLSMKHVWSLDPSFPFYLLVFEQNVKALRFYKRMGAEISKPFPYKNEDGTFANIIKCTWPNSTLLKL